MEFPKKPLAEQGEFLGRRPGIATGEPDAHPAPLAGGAEDLAPVDVFGGLSAEVEHQDIPMSRWPPLGSGIFSPNTSRNSERILPAEGFTSSIRPFFTQNANALGKDDFRSS